jgi:acyl-CoA thioester hydrolase
MHRRVTFAETDMAGILHFSNYFRYMEEVEHAFFRSLGQTVHGHDTEGVWGWARRQASCAFTRPLRYEDVVELHLLVKEKRTRSITYEVVFRCGPGTTPREREVARGTITAVCTSLGSDGTLQAVPMPPRVDALIDEAPRDLFAPD